MVNNTILNRGEFSAFQHLFAKKPLLFRHSYSLARGLLFSLAGISLLVLTACAGGGGGSGSSGGSASGGSASAFEVELTFAPIPGGFRIGNQSDFGEFVSLNITATTTSRGGEVKEDPNINITIEFIDSSYVFTVPFETNWTFAIIGTLSDGRQQRVEIDFIWGENKEDHERGGIRSGLNTDGDGRADSVDEDLDGDDVNNDEDQCDDPFVLSHATGWTSNSSTDNDGDGCQDASEDTDDDNDNVRDEAEAAGCVLDPDCDGDEVMDGADIDVDGDGLIEIGTHEELDAVRYALNGNGMKSSENAALNTDGCGGDDGITSCSGYELVDNISLAAYSSGDGWRPLGNDTDDGTNDCQGAAFNGTFEGNGWTISDLSISRSGEDCVGLFGHITADSEIRNLTLRGERVIGRISVGGLVGWGQGARIVSSSAVIGEIKGVVSVGGLVGTGTSSRIYFSSVVADMVNGSGATGPVASRNVGGLVGLGTSVRLYSSSVVVAEVSGTGDDVGGLIGSSTVAQIYSSSVVVGDLSGVNAVGGLVGSFSGKVAYSYVVSGSKTKMLTGEGSGTEVASYWDSETSGVTSGNHGTPQTTSALRMPMDYTGIYDDWDDDEDIFGDGATDEPLAVWCDKDKSGSIEADEKKDDNLIWNFGESDEYPAIRCTPIGPTKWRGLWSLVNGKPQLDQSLLNQELNQ